MDTELTAARESLRRKQEVIDQDEKTIAALQKEIEHLKSYIVKVGGKDAAQVAFLEAHLNHYAKLKKEIGDLRARLAEREPERDLQGQLDEMHNRLGELERKPDVARITLEARCLALEEAQKHTSALSKRVEACEKDRAELWKRFKWCEKWIDKLAAILNVPTYNVDGAVYCELAAKESWEDPAIKIDDPPAAKGPAISRAGMRVWTDDEVGLMSGDELKTRLNDYELDISILKGQIENATPAPEKPRHSEAQLDALVDLIRKAESPAPAKEKAQEPPTTEEIHKASFGPWTTVGAHSWGKTNEAIFQGINALAAKLDVLPEEVRKVVANEVRALHSAFKEIVIKAVIEGSPPEEEVPIACSCGATPKGLSAGDDGYAVRCDACGLDTMPPRLFSRYGDYGRHIAIEHWNHWIRTHPEPPQVKEAKP